MKTEAAIAFNNCLKDVYLALEAAYNGRLEEIYPDFSSDYRFNEFHINGLESDFRDEVGENFFTYFNDSIIKDYIELYIEIDYFRKIHDLACFNKTILKIGIQVKPILNLKAHYDQYLSSFEMLFDPINNNISEYISNCSTFNPIDELTEEFKNYSSEASFFIEFDIDKAKNIADSIEGYLEKIKFWVEIQFKYKQWELNVDEEEKEYIQQSHPNYMQNCTLEIERIERLIELDRKYGKPQEASNGAMANSPKVSEYQWNGTDIDLIELLTSMQELGLITKKGSKNTTRKELISLFESLFGLVIKDPESKLSKSIHRKKGEPNILERMLKAYSDYTSRKLERGNPGKR